MAEASPRLTVVLPLKGRPLFTLRFLWHANRAKLPYRFFIADGEVLPALAGMLENSKAFFPHLDIQYIRYPDDLDYTYFFNKLADALTKVTTPYAVFADNDDFLAAHGIESSLDFLEAHPDYTCCGGGVAGFSVYCGLHNPNHGLRGQFNKFAYRYSPFDKSEEFSSPSITERLRAGARNWWSYYAVHRTASLATVCREIADIAFTDLHLHETFFATRTLTLGKTRSDASRISYLRQYGTSLRSFRKKDWVHHLVNSKFTRDLDESMGRISAIASAADGTDRAEVEAIIRAHFEDRLHSFLKVNYGSLQTGKQILRDRFPALVNWILKRKRYGVGRERAAFMARLRRDGASDAYMLAFESELAAVDDALNGPEFAIFARAHAARLGCSDVM